MSLYYDELEKNNIHLDVREIKNLKIPKLSKVCLLIGRN